MSHHEYGGSVLLLNLEGTDLVYRNSCFYLSSSLGQWLLCSSFYSVIHKHWMRFLSLTVYNILRFSKQANSKTKNTRLTFFGLRQSFWESISLGALLLGMHLDH